MYTGLYIYTNIIIVIPDYSPKETWFPWSCCGVVCQTEQCFPPNLLSLSLPSMFPSPWCTDCMYCSVILETYMIVNLHGLCRQYHISWLLSSQTQPNTGLHLITVLTTRLVFLEYGPHSGTSYHRLASKRHSTVLLRLVYYWRLFIIFYYYH